VVESAGSGLTHGDRKSPRRATLTPLARRHALWIFGAAAVALAGCGDGRRRSVTAPEIPAGDLAMNVHPLGGSVGALQRQALRQLGSSWIRVTLGLTAGTDAARAYTQAAPNVLGVVADTRFDTLDAATWPDRLEAVLRRFPEVRRAQLLNEPDVFNGLSPARYVREFLRPGFERIRERLPGVEVVAAPPVGDPRRTDRFRQMTDAGADEVCDFRAVNAYFTDDRALGQIRGATARPILVTETGSKDPGQHVRWLTDAVPRIRTALGAEQVYWYVLLESVALNGGGVPYSYPGSSVIAGTPGPGGQPRGAAGSGLYALLVGSRAGRVA
jgi:hypothetical protein